MINNSSLEYFKLTVDELEEFWLHPNMAVLNNAIKSLLIRQSAAKDTFKLISAYPEDYYFTLAAMLENFHNDNQKSINRENYAGYENSESQLAVRWKSILREVAGVLRRMRFSSLTSIDNIDNQTESQTFQIRFKYPSPELCLPPDRIMWYVEKMKIARELSLNGDLRLCITILTEILTTNQFLPRTLLHRVEAYVAIGENRLARTDFDTWIGFVSQGTQESKLSQSKS
jgi:hypothetical protein